MKNAVQWSPQQAAFLQWCFTGKGSGVLKARAGTGKTFTIMGAVESIRGQSMVLAFNKAIAVEIDAKLKRKGIDWKKAQAATVHSAGFKAFRKSFPNVEVDEHKVANLLAQAITLGSVPSDLAPFSGTICKLVGFGKMSGIGLRTAIDDDSAWVELIEHYDLLEDDDAEKRVDGIVRAAMRLLDQSNRITDVIDFNDMVYLPLIHKVRFWQFDNVFVDEAQDTSYVRLLIVRAMLKKGGRAIFVGDDRQSIYGFSGAGTDSLDVIIREFNCNVMPLTVTYRCPKAVVEFAKTWCPDYQAHPSAPEGAISAMAFEDFIKRSDLDGDSAIICRNTKPLVSTAFALIRAKVPCKIEGREIGDGLKKIATRWRGTKTLNSLQEKLESWKKREVEKAKSARKDARRQQVEDQFDTLMVIMDRCREVGKHGVSDLVAYIDELFAEQVSGMLTLSSIHRSKGREFDRVYWLDRMNTCPSRYASQEWEKQQENNLQYVAATRAKKELIDLSPPKAATIGERLSEAATKVLAAA